MAVLKNAKHEAVAQAFLADPQHIGWRAYVVVYPKSSETAAKTGWSRLLKNAEFSSRIAELKAAAAEKAALSAAKVLAEVERIAFSNMLDYMRIAPNGEPVFDFSSLTREQAAAIGELTYELVGTEEADGEPDASGDVPRPAPARLPVRKVKFKLHDKNSALDKLMRHFALYAAEKHEHTGKAGGPMEMKDVSELSPLELARRVAFALKRGEQALASKEKP